MSQPDPCMFLAARSREHALRRLLRIVDAAIDEIPTLETAFDAAGVGGNRLSGTRSALIAVAAFLTAELNKSKGLDR